MDPNAPACTSSEYRAGLFGQTPHAGRSGRWQPEPAAALKVPDRGRCSPCASVASGLPPGGRGFNTGLLAGVVADRQGRRRHDLTAGQRVYQIALVSGHLGVSVLASFRLARLLRAQRL
ncbi:hypothetical protein ETD86_46175 [Nonomuraea turkmeniaca]|uniref:Uncharacterized protein n=1 Tax=Nonomuraea turkmeniaca TaxID=103838 RepID=A0A5S4EYM2_9ACTN|nr:hypothetical protein [Nonomuraea turkmeniaca]TMR08824.1 hypothetical protein ETD86_46175 [Nonomuraea turkmeniaca]